MNFLHFTTNLLPIVTMIVLEPIGFVHNTCTTSQAPEFIKKEISEIEILPEYSEGLQDIEQAEYLDLVFSFHHEKRTELVTRIRSGEMKGVFASRSPKRPNHLGITTVKLIRREGGKLYVEGADALDGSPVILNIAIPLSSTKNMFTKPFRQIRPASTLSEISCRMKPMSYY